MKIKITIYCLLITALCACAETRFSQSNLINECKHNSTIPTVTNFPINVSHYKTTPKGDCLIVGSNAAVRPRVGEKMVQITVKPNTCSRDDGWDDCINDRSRVEFYDGKGVKSGSIVTYEYSMFIPKTTDLKQNGSPTILLGQLNTTAGQHYSSPIMVAWAGPSRGITFRTYDSFNWNIS
jgi:hypothetical protein